MRERGEEQREEKLKKIKYSLRRNTKPPLQPKLDMAGKKFCLSPLSFFVCGDVRELFELAQQKKKEACTLYNEGCLSVSPSRKMRKGKEKEEKNYLLELRVPSSPKRGGLRNRELDSPSIDSRA